MAKSSSDQFLLESFRGGMNDQDPPHSLPDDQVVLARNVEFFFSTLGERRKGCFPVDIAGSMLDDLDDIVHMNIHFPEFAEIFENELFAFSATDGVGLNAARRDDTGTWNPFTLIDTPVTTYPTALRIATQTLHAKMFMAYKSAEDRLHVWDGTSIRRTGLKAPTAAPTAVDTAVAGTFAEDRIYRVRFIEQVGAIIKRRSEPSPELTFTPAGVFDGAIVTRPAVVNEGETHWELEASSGDGNFYVIDTVPIGILTTTDQIQPSTGYAAFELSEDIGSYALIPSVKYVKADQDRLILAGNWTDADKGSRVAWTPAWKSLGVGNDERIPEQIDSFVDLDWQLGGELTGISDPVNGVFYAFKWNRVYKLQRTGRADKAYDVFLLSSYRGAIYGSIVAGTDEYGRGCVYFLDPAIGPMRVGAQGVQHIQNIRGTWRRVNTRATNIVAHGIYYPDHLQVHWWVALDSANTPTYKLVLQVNEQRTDADEGGTERGWVVANGRIAEALCSTVVPEEAVDEETGVTQLLFRPYLGLNTPDFIQRGDVGSQDAGHDYRAIILSKPYILSGLLNKFGVMTAALLASANSDPATHINIRFIRDFGTHDNITTTDFLPYKGEEIVIKVFDAFTMSETKALQIEFSDP